MLQIKRPRGGFTLIELMVVIVIIAILAAIAIPKFKQFRDSAKETQTAANVKVIHESLAKYGTDHNAQYPFRVRYYEPATLALPGFNPTDWNAFPATINSEPDLPWYAMGLFGGVHSVSPDWSDNTQTSFVENRRGENKHTIVQPYGWTYDTWYQWFNEYTDPLTAQGYLDAYPENPFLRRPMGSIMWGNGTTNAEGQNIGLNHTIPYEDVAVSPGDFVYTFFYHPDHDNPNEAHRPHEVVPGQQSYKSLNEQNSPLDGSFYVDHIDSYHLWAYGILPMNGTRYAIYPNNSLGMVRKGSGAKKDWDNSGSKDMFEAGMANYFKVTSSAGGAKAASGKKLEF